MTKPALIELVNAALVSIGQEPVVSLDDDSTVSATVTAVRALVNICKRELLRACDWNCARVTRRLVKLAPSREIIGWKYAYRLPEDPECLRVVQISIDGGETFIDLDEYYNRNAGPKESLFDIDGANLVCNAEDVCIKYTGDIDVSLFDANLASAFVAALAAELCYTLPASVSLAEYRSRIARQKLKTARSNNALDRNTGDKVGEVLGARYYGSMDDRLRVDMTT